MNKQYYELSVHCVDGLWRPNLSQDVSEKGKMTQHYFHDEWFRIKSSLLLDLRHRIFWPMNSYLGSLKIVKFLSALESIKYRVSCIRFEILWIAYVGWKEFQAKSLSLKFDPGGVRWKSGWRVAQFGGCDTRFTIWYESMVTIGGIGRA